MMSHKSRYRFNLMRILACNWTIATVAYGIAASVATYCCGISGGGGVGIICHLFYRFQYFTRFHLCAFDARNWWFHLMPIRYRAIHQIKDFVFIGKQQLHCVYANRQNVYHFAQYDDVLQQFQNNSKQRVRYMYMCVCVCVCTFFCIVMSLNLSI